MDEFDSFTVISVEVLAVLLDLPPDLRLSKVETSQLLQGDGTVRTVHLFHFKTPRPQWRGEVDFVYHVNEQTRATSLHSIGYSSSNQEGSRHGAQDETTGATGR